MLQSSSTQHNPQIPSILDIMFRVPGWCCTENDEEQFIDIVFLHSSSTLYRQGCTKSNWETNTATVALHLTVLLHGIIITTTTLLLLLIFASMPLHILHTNESFLSPITITIIYCYAFVNCHNLLTKSSQWQWAMVNEGHHLRGEGRTESISLWYKANAPSLRLSVCLSLPPSPS